MTAVLLNSSGIRSDEVLESLAAAGAAAGEDVEAALSVARTAAQLVDPPGSGRTLYRWEVLATLGAADLTSARVAEPHLDALAILAEAGDHTDQAVDHEQTWGVFAAEGPGMRVTVSETDAGATLSGTKPWCSLAGRLSNALITAHTASDRGLYAISLRGNGIRIPDDRWVARGLTTVHSGPMDLCSVNAVPVGGPGWYLTRPGFAWGGIGVAAVWFGASVALTKSLLTHCRSRPTDQLARMHLGALDVSLTGCRTSLAASAAQIDAGLAAGRQGALLAQRVRGQVARFAEDALLRVGHALGPGPLALDEEHARRVADLQLYVRQHHGERDDAALGDMLLDRPESPW